MARRAFEVLTGLTPHGVIQVDADGQAAAVLTGRCVHAGRIEARVMQGKDERLGWREIAVTPGGEEPFRGTLGGLPAGGPYSVELRVMGENAAELGGTQVKQVYAGDLWVLAGQSNMQGIGDLDERVETPHKSVKCYAMREEWETATEPLHPLIESIDPVHWSCTPEDRPRLVEEARKTRTKGAGLGITFGKELVKRRGYPIGLIPCAHGGTSMNQWSPDKKGEGGRSLYGSLLRRVAACGGKVKGVLWYQGESECGPQSVAVFAEKFAKLVAALREDLQAPDLPFLYVQIGRFVRDGVDGASWNAIRELQRRAESAIPNASMVSAIDLPLDDAIHISTDGLKRLGKRMADAACRSVYGEAGIETGPRLKEAYFANPARTRLKLVYEGVHEKLVSPRRVGGFSIHDASEKPILAILDSYVEPAQPCAVTLKLEPAPPPGAALYYGAGVESFATLTDARDHAAFAFGPLKLDGVPVREG